MMILSMEEERGEREREREGVRVMGGYEKKNKYVNKLERKAFKKHHQLSRK